MFPQKTSRFPQWIAGAAAAIYVISNPTSAAELVTTVMSAIAQFAAALG